MKLGSFHEVNIDLLETYKSREIIESFKNGQLGLVSMFYQDDAIVSFARLDLMSSDTSVLGDINLDGCVELLDVQLLVQLISSGQYQFEADFNQDGVVDLLDVLPFVEILAGL